MRKCFALIIMISLMALGSVSAKNTIRAEDIETFYKTTTYVVLDNNPMSEWSVEIRDAVEKFWTATPYKFINDTEFEQMKGDMDKSFLVRLKVRFPKDKVKTFYNFMTVCLGAAVADVTDMPEVCSIPLGYEAVDQTSWGYKLGSFVRCAQKHIANLRENPSLISSDPFEFYNKNMGDVHNKELWVLEQDLAPDTRSLRQIRDNYRGTVKVVKPEDIKKAIEERNPNVVFLHKVGPEGTRLQARIYKAIIGAGGDKIYYFDYHNQSSRNGDGLLKKDFKRLNAR